MSGSTALDQILAGDDASGVDEASEAPRDEQGRVEPRSEPDAAQETGDPVPAEPVQTEGPPPSQDVGPMVPRAALEDERKKRQRLEAELAWLQQQAAQYQQPAAVSQEAISPPPDMFTDPEAFAEWSVEQAAVLAGQMAEAKALEALRLERIRNSAMQAQLRFGDYEEKIAVFRELAMRNPELERAMLEQPDPAGWAYRIASEHMQVSQYGSLEEAIEARVQAELQKRMEALAEKAAPQLPKSLASDRSVGRRAGGPEWGGPKPLGDILR